MLTPWKKSYDQPVQHIKKQRHHFANKGPSNQSYGFSSSHVWMWELDYKESWVPKNWCFWTVVLEKTLESPLNKKKIKTVNSKGSQSWIFTGRPDAEAAALILWQPDAKNWVTWKAPDAGKDWRQEEKGVRWMVSPPLLTWVWEFVMDREAWHATAHGVAKSWMQLNRLTDSCISQNRLCFSLFDLLHSVY